MAPRVSIIVPVLNDPVGLKQTLTTLSAQTDPDFEVLVVDNGSTDDTRAVARAFARRDERVKLLVETAVQSSYAARNRGIRHARGFLLAFVDANVTVEPGWLEAVVERMGKDVSYLGCAVEVSSEGRETFAAKYNRLTDLRVAYFVHRLGFAPTCCLVVRTALVEAVGPFDDRLTSSGDVEFGNRVAGAGYQLVYAPDIVMRHPSRTSVRALVKKAVRIGRGKSQLRRYYPERYGTPLRGIVNPAAYLPPTRRALRTLVVGWESLSIREKLGVFGLFYLLRLAKAYGQLAAVAEQDRSPRQERVVGRTGQV
ncbi:glycosyltransferase family 2 protein [Haladaptatus sp. DYSN1]|uniref:glycosyltransferase n=1 Tax=unclassified Haladaptatus TaxID=2622732 RepID=UPI002406B45F|nr:glycosyltransferase [Haladaptatus sp. DYSN1]